MRYMTIKGKSLDGDCYISTARMEGMLAKGWCIRAMEPRETPQEAYDRLSKTFETVRIYSQSTRVRGLRSYYAMCK